jgi:hypothetical protein
MISQMICVLLSITTSINGTGDNSYYLLHNDTNTTINLTGPIRMETNHIIEGIPDVLPALQPRFPMPAPSL